MKAESVLKLFKIPATKLIAHQDVEKWRLVLKDYRDFDEREVEQELHEIMETLGANCSTLHYLAEVRKKMLLRTHYSLKRLPMIPSIKAMFR